MTEKISKSPITIVMVAYNEIENVKVSVQSIRLFADVDVSLILVDNGSADGLQNWAKEQEDLTYVFMDEGHISCGKVMNMVRRELQIDTDLLIMGGHFMLTPGYLLRLAEVLYAEENVGAVGGLYNGGQHCQNIPYTISDYKMAIEAACMEGKAEGKRALMLFSGATLWKKDVLDELGEFEEGLDGLPAVIDDYCLRMIMKDKKMMVCTNAFLWSLLTEHKIEDEYAQVWEMTFLEKKWGMHYFNGGYNRNVIGLIEAEKYEEIAVLEIGCDCGATLMEIKNRYPNARVYGSEINERSAAIAAHFAQVEVNNIEEKNLSFPKKMFDYIIFADVLEHLHDPLETVNYCREFLREGGMIIASIPNVMHISVMEQLMHGNFTYMPTGLLDKTHIHLFTYKEIVRMFNAAGYEVVNVATTQMSITDKQSELIDRLLEWGEGTERFMYETFQYIVKAKLQ